MSNVHHLHLRTPAQARQWLRENGYTMRRFARECGLNYLVLADVLRGKNKGLYGHGHTAAVALGIKPPPRQPIRLANESPAPSPQL